VISEDTRSRSLLREVIDRKRVGDTWCSSARAGGINSQACSFNRGRSTLSDEGQIVSRRSQAPNSCATELLLMGFAGWQQTLSTALAPRTAARRTDSVSQFGNRPVRPPPPQTTEGTGLGTPQERLVTQVIDSRAVTVLAPQAGLEPATLRLTEAQATNQIVSHHFAQLLQVAIST
jgi:hypothetical protein